MTRKDFVLIATTIRSLHELGFSQADQERVALEFARALRSTNVGFKRDVFLIACGVSTDTNQI